MKDVPNSYRDQFWSDLAAGAEKKLGLPEGLLVSVLTKGERSNADQVSEAGAKTPFQIIPETRKAILDKYGIDAYLSPENAAEAAGIVLRDGLNWAKTRTQDPAALPRLAAGYYHAGGDTKQWGPRTVAYMQRVAGAAKTDAQPQAPAGGAPQSTFQRALANQQAAQAPATAQIANIYAAYQGGQMTPEEAAQFEQDVNEGRLMLPRGASLKNAPAAPGGLAATPGGIELPQAVADAYASGAMSREDRMQLEQDVKAGMVKLPAGVKLQETKPLGLVGSVVESVTGRDRATQQTEALPEWGQMPELNSFTLAGMKAGVGTLLASPAEGAQIIKANFPGVKVEQDAKGNFLLTSSIDGKQYAIPPGFKFSDIFRGAGAVAAYTPAGRATTLGGLALASGATQAAIEGTQAASGGEFNPGDVVMAGALAPVIPAAVNATRAAMTPARQLLQNVRGGGAAAAAAGQADDAARAAAQPAQAAAAQPAPAVNQAAPAAAAPVQPAAQAATMNAAELAQTARKAAEGGMGSKRATQVLAEQAAPNPKTIEAAKRLGIDEYLQPDHVTTNQAYREVAQAVKSVPGSAARQAELQGLEQVAKRADDLIAKVGGETDLSRLDATVRANMTATQRELEGRANALYAQVREGVPATTSAPADKVLAFVKQRAGELGGEANLSPMEKQILGKLAPKNVKGSVQQPTYALLDDVRKDVGAVTMGRGPFKDADTGLAKKLYSLISDDQAAVVGQMGMADVYNAARSAVAVRKGLEDDMTSLFGRELDQSLVGRLNTAVNDLPKGDVQKLAKLISAVPADMRQNVVATGLNAAFGKTVQSGTLNFSTYAKWYEGLLRNKQAYSLLMTNLPREARKQLSDLYRVSNGVRLASKERILTGRIQAVQQDLQGADSLLGNLYGLAKRSAIAVPAEAASSAMGLPGAGLSAGIASALTKGKPNTMKAADTLISSPEFIQAARAAGTPQAQQAARRLAYSKAFTKFARAVGNPRELSNRERWILRAMQAQNNLEPNQQQGQ